MHFFGGISTIVQLVNCLVQLGSVCPMRAPRFQSLRPSGCPLARSYSGGGRGGPRAGPPGRVKAGGQPSLFSPNRGGTARRRKGHLVAGVICIFPYLCSQRRGFELLILPPPPCVRATSCHPFQFLLYFASTPVAIRLCLPNSSASAGPAGRMPARRVLGVLIPCALFSGIIGSAPPPPSVRLQTFIS